ncbi:MAG: hypothetical protein FD138_237 [Planctomycetota bacterium]|nr:MAG: hypothetical protein FD138_237 [Planctomycetota bacterium]
MRTLSRTRSIASRKASRPNGRCRRIVGGDRSLDRQSGAFVARTFRGRLSAVPSPQHSDDPDARPSGRRLSAGLAVAGFSHRLSARSPQSADDRRWTRRATASQPLLSEFFDDDLLDLPQPSRFGGHEKIAGRSRHMLELSSPRTMWRGRGSARTREPSERLCSLPHAPLGHRDSTPGLHAPSDRHSRFRGSSPGRPGVLRPVLEVVWTSDREQQRAFGLGYLEAANRESEPAHADEYRRRALELMTNVLGTGLPDSVLESSLARLQFDLQLDGSQSLATSALSRSDLIGQDRCNAMFVVADLHVQKGRWSDAVTMLEQLTAARRHNVDWLMLADCQRKLGQPDAETRALVTATRINTRLGNVHDYLAKRFAKEGNLEQAEWHKKRAVP